MKLILCQSWYRGIVFILYCSIEYLFFLSNFIPTYIMSNIADFSERCSESDTILIYTLLHIFKPFCKRKKKSVS